MEWGTISMVSIGGMIFSLAIAVGAPIVLCIWFGVKKKAKLSSFFLGCGIFLVFAMVLEQLLHVFVFKTIGETLQNNIFLYGIYGGLAAAAFEESGRLVAFRFFMKKRLNKENAFMYGIGHGGVEAILIVGVASINNIITSIMINSGGVQATIDKMDPSLQQTTFEQLRVLWETPGYEFYLAGVERGCAMVLHICLSIFVFKFVETGKKKFFVKAFVIHALVDFVTVVAAHSMPIIVIEVVLVIVVSIIAIFTRKLYCGEEQRKE